MKTIHQKLKSLKSSAKARGLNIKLSSHEYKLLLDGNCIYCGKNLHEENGYCLDRLDSNGDYTFNNLAGCCKVCNMAKGTMGFIEFYDWIKRVYSHQEFMFKECQTQYTCSESEFKKMIKDSQPDDTYFLKIKNS